MTIPTTTGFSPTGQQRSVLPDPFLLLVVFGCCCVVVGGLIAAVTGPLKFADGSWLAAYLVLVGGAGQCILGWMPRWIAARPTPRSQGWAQLTCWNAGNAAIIAGTLGDLPVAVDVGGALLVAGLAIAWHATRHSTQRSRASRAACWTYRCFLLVLLISIPVGAALAHLRSPI